MAERAHRARCSGSKADNRQAWARAGGRSGRAWEPEAGGEGLGTGQRVEVGVAAVAGTGESTSCLEHLVQGMWWEMWGQGGSGAFEGTLQFFRG